MSDSDGKKTLGVRSGPRSGQVKQSFSHGRTKNVVVETKRKRVVMPKPAGNKPVSNGPTPISDPSKRPAGISDAELDRRMKALAAAKARESEEAEQRAVEEKARAEERDRRRAEQEEKERAEREREEALKAKAEEDQRRVREEAAAKARAAEPAPNPADVEARAARPRPRSNAPQGRSRAGPRRKARQGCCRQAPVGQADCQSGAGRGRGRTPTLHGGDEAQAGAGASEGDGPEHRAREGRAGRSVARSHHGAGAGQPDGRACGRCGEIADAKRYHGDPDPDDRRGYGRAYYRGIRPQAWCACPTRTSSR